MSLSENDIENVLSCYLHSKILEIFAYGVYTAVYSVSLYLTLSRGTDKPRVHSAVLITIMWVLATVHASLRWTSIDHIYVRNGESRETQLAAILVNINLSQDITSFIGLFLSVLMADFTMIWRCWVLFGRRWLIIIVPTLSLAMGIVAEIFQGIAWLHSRDSLAASISQNTWYIIFLSASVFTNIFCTVSIIYRIITLSGYAKALKTYHGILEILVESALLYTVIYLIQIGLRVYGTYFASRWDPRFLYGQSLTNVITGIAPTLIIARVAAGHARPDDSWTRTSLPHLRTTMQSLAESMHFVRPAGRNDTTDIDLERSTPDSQVFEPGSGMTTQVVAGAVDEKTGKTGKSAVADD